MRPELISLQGSVRYASRIASLINCWGHHAEWMRPGERATGHHTPPPQDGDILYAAMESGRVGMYRLVNVERMSDPPDQWFADTEWVGYEDDVRAGADAS